MNVHKQIVTTAILLMLFAGIGAALVGLTFDSTIEKIKYNEKQMRLRQLNTIVPKHKYDNDLLLDTIELKADPLLGTAETSVAYLARKNNKPVAIVLSAVAPGGYNGSIHLLVGIYNDGEVAGVRVVKHKETPGLGDAIEEKRSDWILGFNNKSLTDPKNKQWKVKRDGGVFDQFTGATITPRAIVKAVHSALKYYKNNRKTLFTQKRKDHAL